jgi:pyridoxamine 5'-phosphate oxidase family protein
VSVFTDKEIGYLLGQEIGRLATANATGRPHVVPVRFRLGPDRTTLEIGGRDLPERGQERRYLRDVHDNPSVAFVCDDALEEPWTPRGVSLHGQAKVHTAGGQRFGPRFGPVWLEIIPTGISSWGVDTDGFAPPASRTV